VSALEEIEMIILLFRISLIFPISKPVSLAQVSLIVAVIEIELMMHARTSKPFSRVLRGSCKRYRMGFSRRPV
jgi:hypothetical protein